MDIEKWKEFSDAVDAHNEIAYAEHRKNDEEYRKKEDADWEELKLEHEKNRKHLSEVFGYELPRSFLMRPLTFSTYFLGVQKTEVNFWEWCAGKLELRHA